jgi:phenylacetate-CoA ligase
MSKLTDRVYASSPVWVQKVGINAFGWYWARRRLGGDFQRFSQAYEERESWDQDRFRGYLQDQLRAQVQRAYREVPMYREAFRSHGVSEGLLERFTLEDLNKLPLLDKSKVRANSAALLTETAAKNPPKYFNTSGTTGTPLRVYWDFPVHQHNIAVRAARSFRWAGVKYQEPRAVLAGRIVVPPSHHRPPFWRYNIWEKQLYLSTYHILRENLPDYVAAINRFKPVTMTGFASANYFLAKLIGESNLEVHSPRAIITTSERLAPEMREVLERVYNSRAYQEYGGVENCALASECEKGRMHVHPDFGLVEILHPDGTEAAPGEVGEMVLTGFANVNQIFIRYRVGDLAAWSKDPCPCGRTLFPVLAELSGRQEDIIILPDGREMTRFDFLFKDLDGVREGQFVQEDLNHFVINLVPTSQYTSADADEIRERMRVRYGVDSGSQVEIRTLERIPLEKNGKFRPVLSRLKRSARIQDPH